MGTQGAKAEKRYREFVHAGMEGQSPWDQLKSQSLLGEDGFADKLLPQIRGSKEIPKGQRFLGRPTLEHLLKQREKETGKFKKRSRSMATARKEWPII